MPEPIGLLLLGTGLLGIGFVRKRIRRQLSGAGNPPVSPKLSFKNSPGAMHEPKSQFRLPTVRK